MMNQMTMAGMNPAQGGPVGGGMMMMNNNGAPATPSNGNTQDEMKQRLNTYIYDYFLNFGYHDHARALVRDEKFEISTKSPVKSSPGRRKDGEVNGIDDNAMDTDSKDDPTIIPDDLPRPQVPNDCPGSAFLFDWFCLFNDIFKAQRQRKPNQRDSTSAHTYLEQTQSLQRMRENQQNAQLMRGPQMMGGQNQFAGMRGMRNGMMPNDMRAAAMQKNMTPQQLQAFQQNKLMQQQQHQMQREHSDMDMNGHRPQSPADPDNVGSPSKRPRLGEQQYNGQMAPNGRGQGVPGVGPQGGGMLMQTGLNPKVTGQGQFQGFAGPNQAAMQQKLMQSGMPNGMMNPAVMANQGSPMLQPMNDNQFMGNMPMGDLYGAQMRANGGMQGPGATGGNHALQDYQMQLMLLEQQNKKRLMMARQEQDNISRDGGPMPGQPGMQPPGMSPSGSRTGTSPNPSEQMKRGTPQLGGLPQSPLPGDGMQQGRGSPSAMGFMGGMPQDFNNPMMMKNGNDGMVGPGGAAMRPGGAMNTSLNMEAMARAQQGRMPGGNWQAGPQGQPMMPQPSQGQPQPMGTPNQRSDMPPPQAPPTGSANPNRTQPSSPQPGQAPPTPSQSNKPAPKKKDKNETRKRPNKKNSTANAPSTSEPERATTPTPPTPVTPQHPNSFTGTAGKGPMAAGGGAGTGNAAPTSNPSIPQPQQQIPPPDNIQGPYGDPNFTDQAFNLDFSGLETSDVLNDFDFDSFLNNTDDGSGAWGSIDPSLGGDFNLESTNVE